MIFEKTGPVPIITENFWRKIKFFLPQRDGKKIGRPRSDDKLIMSGILFLLRTGCQWNILPKFYGSSSTIHRRFQEWSCAGSFELMWEMGLMEISFFNGLNLEFQSVDGGIVKAPLGGEATGKSPVDRGKIGTKRSLITDGQGLPIGVTIGGANQHDLTLFEKTLQSVSSKIEPDKLQKVCTDLGYDSEKARKISIKHFYIPHGRSKNEKYNVSNESLRWVVERTFGWINRFRRILIRWEKKVENYKAMLHLAFTVIIYKKLRLLG